jgi:glycosyltransferase involved in cell wall biosynthesis
MLAPEFFPVWGGVGSYIVELIKFLPKDVNIYVITLKRQIAGMSESKWKARARVKSVIDRPIQIRYLSTSKETFFYNLPFQIACLRKLPSLQKEHHFDILHSHLCHMPDVFLQLLNRIRIPTVLTVHGTIQMLRNQALQARSLFGDLEWGEKFTVFFYPIIKMLQQKYVKKVSRFIAVSNITREMTMKHLRVDEERISVLYNGVDINVFHPPRKDEMERKYARPTVVYVGRLIAKKGIPTLIKAMPRVLQRFPQTRFLFVGGGKTIEYEELVKRIGINRGNFSFVGHVGYFERLKILREATVFVNPSLFENCSLSILEAMSSGSAVVASDVGANPEMIESGKNGLLVPVFDHEKLAESMISLLEDEDFNRKVGKKARRTVERRFSSKKSAEETYELYKQILIPNLGMRNSKN